MEDRGRRKSAMEIAADLETTASLYEDNENPEMRAIASCYQICAEVIAQGRVRELYEVLAPLRTRQTSQNLEIQKLVDIIEGLNEANPRLFN